MSVKIKMSYILFYSNYCKHSKQFIMFLEKAGYSHYFNKICVDKDSYGKRPKIIKQYNVSRIPTIIVNRNILTDISAFKWLDKHINDIEAVPRPNDPMASRDNKMDNIRDKSEKNELLPFDQSDSGNIVNNCLSINNNDSYIEYPEDNGEFITDRSNSDFIMQDDNLQLVDAEPFADKRMKTVNKNDSLKKKQFDNSYEKLLAERKTTENRAPSRI
jgi:hypothetical protein